MPPRSPAEAPREAADHPADARPHGSPAVRAFFIVLGTVFVGLGIAGAVLPVLPTTPFLLLAAACYARGSVRFYRWLIEHRTFGPTIVEWRRHRSIPWRTKLVAIGLMSAMIAVSAVLFVRPWWAQALLVAVGAATGAWLWRIPSRDRPPRAR